MGFSGSSWLFPPTNLLATLAGSFSVSLWARTSDHPGNDADTADLGAGLLSGNFDQVIPMALTGGKLALLTGGGTPDTLHSAASINTGSYVHLVVTRDQLNGQKKIYINGNLDASDFGAFGPLSTSQPPSPYSLFLGMNSTFSRGFKGDMDEVQIYSGALSANEVAYLYSHSSTNVADVTSQDVNNALNTSGLGWGTGGNASWFIETTNTHDNVSAAQSGAITNGRTSILQTTVTGPGTLTFWWQNASNDSSDIFDLEFDIDGSNIDDLSGPQTWIQGGPYTINAGTHTLGWIARGGDNSADAGYLDQVTFMPTPVVTLLNPRNTGTSFQFQFSSQVGLTHTVQYCTNLTSGNWITYSSIPGNGTMKTISIPLTVFNPSKQAFVRVSTQ